MEERAPVDRPTDGPDPRAPAAAVDGDGGATPDFPEDGGAVPDVPEASGAGAAQSRSSRRPRDMVISLLVLVVPVLVLIGGYQVLSGRTSPVEVDPAPAINSAAAAGMEVARPEGLPDGWVPVSAVFQPAEADETGDTLRIGYVTPDGASVQVVQSTVPAEELLPAELPDSPVPGGSAGIAGEQWQQYEGSEGNRALALLETDTTVIVRGAASQDELSELAASLR